MGPLITTDVLLLAFSIYIGIFFKKFHSSYPNMQVGFHVWEVCFSEDTWYYGNNFVGNLSIILGLIFFGLIYPLLIYFLDNRNYLSVLIVIIVILYLALLILITKLRLRNKFDLKDK